MVKIQWLIAVVQGCGFIEELDPYRKVFNSFSSHLPADIQFEICEAAQSSQGEFSVDKAFAINGEPLWDIAARSEQQTFGVQHAWQGQGGMGFTTRFDVDGRFCIDIDFHNFLCVDLRKFNLTQRFSGIENVIPHSLDQHAFD